MLATLYQGDPLRWPRLLQTCQATMNAAVHTSTARQPYLCKKLCVKWNGPYKIVEVLRDGGGYIVKEPFTGQMLQRAAEKVKTFGGSEEYVVEPQDTVFQADLETEVLPPRVRRRPPRYVEEC